MEGYAIVKFGEPLQHVVTETPEPKGREVLIEVTHSGVCHSDLHFRSGGYDLGSRGTLNLASRGLSLPLIPGHEIVGRVAKFGELVEGLEVGDVRLVFPWIGCGECERCRAEEQNLCPSLRPIGVGKNGGYATHVLVPDARYLLDIEGIDPSTACTYACSGVTVFGAIRKLGKISPAETVVVIGAGGLGLNAISILKALGFQRVCVSDTDPKKLQAAERQGASATVLATADLAATSAAVSAACGGSVMSVIDTVNSGSTVQVAFDALSRGGRIIHVGLFGGEFKLPVALMVSKSATLRGTSCGGFAEMRDLIALAKSGALPALPTNRRTLHEVNEVLTELEEGKIVGRTILVSGGAGAA